MKRKTLAITVAVILVLIIGGFLWWALIRPALVDDVVNEAAPVSTDDMTLEEPVESIEPEALAEAQEDPSILPPPASEPRGSFVGAGGHEGTGSVLLIGTTLRLEENFRVTNGPDLYVYIGDANGPVTQVARLKGNVGSQNYDVSGIDVSAGQYVWIYCVAFSEQFAKAELQ